MTGAAPRIRCYYDADCGFCTRMVERVRRLAKLPEDAVLPAQSDPEILEIMERENSWVVVDRGGEQHLRWSALSVTLRQRAILRPIAFIMRWPGVAHLGDRVYRWIANNRGSL